MNFFVFLITIIILYTHFVHKAIVKILLIFSSVSSIVYFVADRQDAVEHRLQVSRRVRKLYDEDVLAQSAELPGSRQSVDAQVLEGPWRGRGHCDRHGQPEDVGQKVVRSPEAQAQVCQVVIGDDDREFSDGSGAGGRTENHRTRLSGTVPKLLRQGFRDRVHGNVRPILQPDVGK